MAIETEIKFELIDTTAKGDGTPICSDVQPFADVTDLTLDGVEPLNPATLEDNLWILDGSMGLFSDAPETYRWGLWSASMSGADTLFAAPVVLTVTFTEPHTSNGITLQCYGDSWANNVTITWYGGTAVLAVKQFRPDKQTYHCTQQVENYDKIVISFAGMTLPYRYLKLAGVIYGEVKLWSDADLTAGNIVEECDPISSELRISSINFQVYSDDDDFNVLNPRGIYASLQERQPITVYRVTGGNRVKYGTYYLDSWENASDNVIGMNGVGAVGLLDKQSFEGGLYTEKAVTELLDEMIGAGLYRLDTVYTTTAVTGKIDSGTKRDALQQILFVLGAAAHSDADGSIVIAPPQTTAKAAFDEGAIVLEGRTLTLLELVTGVEVTAHSYDEAGSDTSTVVGYYTPSLPANTAPKVLRITNATLVNPNNAAAVARRIYEYYQQRHKFEFSAMLDGERAGDMVTAACFYGEDIQGIIESLDISLTGGYIGAVALIGSQYAPEALS